MLEVRIYVGLDDKDTHEQLYDTEDYKSVLKEICKKYNTSFSLQVIEGGYFHDDGTWVDENTLLVTLIGIPLKRVYIIAKELCETFNQESVMITSNSVLTFNLHDYKDKETRYDEGDDEEE